MAGTLSRCFTSGHWGMRPWTPEAGLQNKVQGETRLFKTPRPDHRDGNLYKAKLRLSSLVPWQLLLTWIIGDEEMGDDVSLSPAASLSGSSVPTGPKTKYRNGRRRRGPLTFICRPHCRPAICLVSAVRNGGASRTPNAKSWGCPGYTRHHDTCQLSQIPILLGVRPGRIAVLPLST